MEGVKRNLLVAAVILLLLSGAVFLWSNNYINAHPFTGLVGAVVGSSDSTYDAAKALYPASIGGFVLGVVLLLAGLLRQK